MNNGHQDVLCIGLDIAWFGGSVKDKDSQYDCLGTVLIPSQDEKPVLTLTRIPLGKRDPDSVQLLTAIDKLLEAYQSQKRIIFALDAPIQAADHGLPPRTGMPSKGAVERRACEDYLDNKRKELEKKTRVNGAWRPKIQPGAPLAPRVKLLLNGLQERGFSLWTDCDKNAEKLVIECFPSEAIWSIKQMGHYPDSATVECVKAYKKQKGVLLSTEEVKRLVHDTLDAFISASGNSVHWPILLDQAINWMLNEKVWQSNGGYRGGKLFDDVVDTMICLATSLSYAYGQAHVWQDPERLDDGHIIGPGFSNEGGWTPASISSGGNIGV